MNRMKTFIVSLIFLLLPIMVWADNKWDSMIWEQDCWDFACYPSYSVPTPSGSDVTVTFPNGDSVKYDYVDSLCTTTLTEITTPDRNPPPNFNFIRYGYFDISTDCLYSGPVTVTFPYVESEIRGQEQNLKLFHWENNGWRDCTVSVDYVNNTITGRVTNLSLFAIGFPIPLGPVGPATGINTYMIVVLALIGISTGLSLIRKCLNNNAL